MKNEGLRVLQRTLRALSQPVIAIDSRGVIVAANPSATNLFSADSNALAEKVFDSVFEHPLDALRPYTNQGVAAFGQWQNVVARHDNGKRVPLAICVERLVNNTDELLLLSLRPGRAQNIAPSRGIVDSLLQNENFPFLYLDAKSVVLAASPAKVGHVMGLQTIAEFVESPNILTKLTEIGVDFSQGIGIAPPTPLTGEARCGRNREFLTIETILLSLQSLLPRACSANSQVRSC